MGDPTLQLPVIDISKVDEVTGRGLIDVVAQYGFVFIRGAEGIGFTPSIIDNIFYMASGLCRTISSKPDPINSHRNSFRPPLKRNQSCAIKSDVMIISTITETHFGY